MADIWKDKTKELPVIKSDVVVKYAAGSERAYGIIQVNSVSEQTEILSDTTIVGWQYLSYFKNAQVIATKTLLSGHKEGTDNDWAATIDGYIQNEYDIYMLRQQINARIQTLPNEVDGFDGIDYMNVIFGNTSVEQKAAAFAEVIQNIPAVKSVTFISASWIDKVKGTFQFVFDIQSVFGDLQFQIGLDSQNRKVLAQN